MLEPRGERALEVIEADPRARVLFVAAVVLAASAALVLTFLAFRPAAENGSAADLRALLNRAWWGAVVATGLAVAVAVVSWRLALRVVATGRWPPDGMKVPFRTRVQQVSRPVVVWGLAGSVVVAVTLVALLYWAHYLEAREWAGFISG